MSTGGDGTASDRRHKIVRLIEEYDLDGLGADLERRWTGTGSERSSLRDLADLVNERLVERTLADTDWSVVDGEVENVCRLLTDESVSRASRTRAVRQLERSGVDVDALESDFVSYQAVRSYLTEFRGVEYRSESEDPVAATAQQVAKLEGRVSAVVEDKLQQLSDGEDVSVGSFVTLVEVDVLCEDCGSTFRVDEFLDRGVCECETPDAGERPDEAR